MTGATERPMVPINESNIMRMECAKVFTEHADRINGLDFVKEGTSMITSSEDDAVHFYDCITGTKSKTVQSKKYGVALIRYTHNTSNAIHCSTKVSHDIRYLSLHDNKYIRYFAGHTERVQALSMSPNDDTFLSASEDNTVRLWDLRTANCQGMLNSQAPAIAAYDPDGLIFAAGINQTTLKLYDLKSYDKGPFNTFKLEEGRAGARWTGLKFSPDGKHILVMTNQPYMLLVDAFHGNIVHTLSGHANTTGQHLEATFSPCAQFVLCGGTDGSINVWSCERGILLGQLDLEAKRRGLVGPASGRHPAPVGIVSFNPRHFVLASCCTHMHLWLPPEDVIPE